MTICVKHRRTVSATPEVFEVIKTAIPQLQKWCFDSLIRSEENLWSKWIYLKEHPGRPGVVQAADRWRCYLNFINETPSPGKLSASLTGQEY